MLRRKIKEQGFNAMLLAPFMFNQYVLFVATAILVVLLAFTSMDASMSWDFNGSINFRKALNDPRIGLIIMNTVIFVGMTLLFKVVWGFVIAVTTTYYIENKTVGSWFRMIWLLPRVSPGVVEAMLWTWIFSSSQYGVLNILMHAMYGSEPVAWLDKYPLLINILLAGVMGSSLSMVVLSSAMQSINKSYFYVAKVDGASELSILCNLIIPFLRWPIMFLVIWQGLALFTSYESILLLTDGGPNYQSETWALYSFHKAFSSFDFGYGSAIALFILPVVFVVMFLAYRVFGFHKLMNAAK
jgi:inositol-phosphate transport system permease protein